MKQLILSISIFICVFNAVGQQDLSLYYMDNLQQVEQVNPARRPKFKVNVGIPGLSSIYFNHFNTVFTPKDFFKNSKSTIFIPTNGKMPELRKQHLKRMWTNRNYIGIHVKEDLIHFGFVLKENYVNFSITENVSARVTLPGDLLEFPIRVTEDPTQFDGKTQSFRGLNLHLNHYREYGIGISHPINENINIGGKIKYLYGMENVYTKKNSLRAGFDTNDKTIYSKGEIKINSSGLSSLGNESAMNYLFKKKNRGLGLDLGIENQLNEKTTVSLSVTDLGFIRWKNGNKNLVASNGNIGDKIVDVSEEVLSKPTYSQDSVDNAINDLSNDLSGDGLYEYNSKKYTTFLITQVYFGGIRKLYETEKLSGKASALLHAEVYKWRVRPSLTLAYYQTVGKWLQVNVSYSYINRDFRNLGAGFTAKLGPFQYYLIIDNLMPLKRAKIQFGDEGKPSQYPKFSKTIHLKTGINLVFRKRKLGGRFYKNSKGNPTKFKKDKYSCPTM